MVYVHIRTCVYIYMYESQRKAFSRLLGEMEKTNQMSFIPFKCFICLKPVKNVVLINADSLFLQQAISWFQASDWNNVLSPNGRQKTSLGLRESLSTLRTSWQRFTEQSLVKVTLKNLEQSEGFHKKDRILKILHVTNELQPVRNWVYYASFSFNLNRIYALQSELFR